MLQVSQVIIKGQLPPKLKVRAVTTPEKDRNNKQFDSTVLSTGAILSHQYTVYCGHLVKGTPDSVDNFKLSRKINHVT